VTEPSDAGYARQTVILNEPVLGDHYASVSSKTGVIFGPVTMKTWDFDYYIAVFDQAGNMLLSGQLDLPDNSTFTLDAGAIQLRIDGSLGGYVSSAIINWMRGIKMPSPPTQLKVALSTANPKIDASGLAEINTNEGYERQVIAFAEPTYIPEVGTTLEPKVAVSFGPAAINTWDAVSHGAVFDQSDNLIFFGAFGAQRNVPIGDTLPLPPASIQLLIR
jgi:hypothetical protein